jgi:PEP-CTERM motif
MSLRKASGIDRSFLTRLLQITGLSLALMTASAAGVHAQVIGANGANGADGVNPGDSGLPGGDGESVAGSGTVMGGNGGAGGNAAPPDLSGNGGNGGNGGAATATGADANAVGGRGGAGGSPAAFFNGSGGSGGAGGSATAIATGSSVSASAMGGSGGLEFSQFPNGGDPGAGGDANATANASAGGGGTATANAVANGGLVGDFGFVSGAANATSNAETAKGAMAQAQSSGFGGSSGEYQSTAETSLDGVRVQSTAMAPSTLGGEFGEFETTDAIAQGGDGQPVDDAVDDADAFSTILPDRAYAATLIDGASNVADALLGPRDKVFGTAILGTQGFGDNAESTFDFRFQGDLLLGLIDGSGEFSINGVEMSFVDDTVINLGNLGPNIDLTLSVDGSGVFAVGVGAVPEPSTWAMMLLGFAGLAFAGSRRAKAGRRNSRALEAIKNPTER